jgi:hypothetical protein
VLCDLKVGVSLACIPFSLSHVSEIKFLVKIAPTEMPTISILPGEDVIVAASNLLHRLVGVKARIEDRGWVDLKLSSCLTISSDPWSVVLVYGGMVPDELPVVEEGYAWMSWENLKKPGVVDPRLAQAMVFAAQRM